jgi:predicted  nucleic acid-binding Zn-ribbon protein
MLLLTFEEKDNMLRQKQERCQREKNDIQSNTTDFQGKLDAKIEDQTLWVDKMDALTTEFKTIVPENHAHFEILTKIFKKKIKCSKGGDDLDGEDFEEDDEDDDDDDDDYDDDEVEDVCPPGCDVTLYDKVLDFREKRLDIEEVMAEIQKTLDDLKKSKDRLKQREKQIDKDAKSTETEIASFQRQKQAALNKIEVYVPLKVSQLNTFTCSGIISGPTDDEERFTALKEDPDYISDEAALKDPNQRTMVAEMDITSHTVFKSKDLDRLSARIHELRDEIIDAKASFKELHKEKVRLEKERGAQRKKIENWSDKVSELQMLKFGRLIDLDVLEQGSDRTKENEAEATVAQVESEFQNNMTKLMATLDEIKIKFADVSIG